MLECRRNLGRTDQLIRMLLGAGLLYAALKDPSPIHDPILATLLGGFGLVNIVVALLGSCPVYAMAGSNTARPNPGLHG